MEVSTFVQWMQLIDQFIYLYCEDHVHCFVILFCAQVTTATIVVVLRLWYIKF